MRTSELPEAPSDRLLLPGENFIDDDYTYKLPDQVRGWLGESADAHAMLARQYAHDERMLDQADELKTRLRELSAEHGKVSAGCIRLLFLSARANEAGKR